MARATLRREVDLAVDELDAQAKRLLATNYVNKEQAHYRNDLVDDLSDERRVPACFEACATIIASTVLWIVTRVGLRLPDRTPVRRVILVFDFRLLFLSFGNYLSLAACDVI